MDRYYEQPPQNSQDQIAFPDNPQLPSLGPDGKLVFQKDQLEQQLEIDEQPTIPNLPVVSPAVLEEERRNRVARANTGKLAVQDAPAPHFLPAQKAAPAELSHAQKITAEFQEAVMQHRYLRLGGLALRHLNPVSLTGYGLNFLGKQFARIPLVAAVVEDERRRSPEALREKIVAEHQLHDKK